MVLGPTIDRGNSHTQGERLHMRATTSWAAALFLIGLGGCGGGGGGPRGPLTHTLESRTPFAVPAGVCDAVSGPFSVGAGTMAFTVVDTPTGIGSDTMDFGIMFDSDFVAGGCNFDLAVVHDV